jgi:glycosyltransferase involved in cell wall biosynthesis
MKIVMDFRKYDGVVGGVEQGVIQVTYNMTKNGHLVVLLCKKIRLAEVSKVFEGTHNLKIIPLETATHVMNRKNARLDSTVIQDIAEAEGAGVIHFPYNWSFPNHKKVPSVLTVHDVIPFNFREAQSIYMNLFKYKPGIRKACRLNDVIATVSNFSRQDIAEKVGVSLDKIRVIHNGLREPHAPDRTLYDDLSKRLSLDGRFILNVGGIHERKNIVRLIYAFSQLVRRSGYGGKLIITGKVSGAPYQEKMKKLCDDAIDESRMKDRVVFTGFITERELDALFHNADFLIYPSLYEGFGIPVVEAMKLGLPVITAETSALPEIAGGAALLINPENIEEMVSRMQQLLQDGELREELRRKGFRRARMFTWEKTTEQYLGLYRELAEKS